MTGPRTPPLDPDREDPSRIEKDWPEPASCPDEGEGQGSVEIDFDRPIPDSDDGEG